MSAHTISCGTHRYYYLSCEEYEELWDFASGRCQICNALPEETARGKLCIDHLPTYGYGLVRGLLCDKCNALMRQVDDGTVRYPPSPVYAYRHNSWFARQIMFGRGFNVKHRRWRWPTPLDAPEGETA